MSVESRVLAACRATADDRALRSTLLEVLRDALDFDAHVWLLTDPETCVGSSPLAQVPSMQELPTLIRLRYLEHGWTAMAAGASVSWSGRPPMGEGSLAWRALLRTYGVQDVATTVFRDRSGCWGFLDLWRDGRPFAAAELDLLSRLSGPVTRALRRCQAAAFGIVDEQVGVREPAVLLLTTRLVVRNQTAASEGFLRALLPTEDDRRPVPATAYNVGAQMLAVETGSDHHPPLCRVSPRPGQWLTFRAARLRGSPDGAASDDVAVTIEPTPALERLDLFTRAHDLTSREGEVLRSLAEGDDTRAVAARLYMGEYTVQDHLKSIFDKSGVRSRRVLLARALG